MDWEKLSRDFQTQCWIILLILGSISFFLMPPAFTLGVILGGLVIIANFSLFQHTLASAFSPEGVMKNKKKSIIVKYYFRLAILAIIIYILVTKDWVDTVGLTIGFSIVVINIFSIGIRSVFKKSSREAI